MDQHYRKELLTLLSHLDQGLADTDAILNSPILAEVGLTVDIRLPTQELRELLFKLRRNVEEKLERAQRSKH
jgi:hypothetical protein